jgi:hypothetical protein
VPTAPAVGGFCGCGKYRGLGVAAFLHSPHREEELEIRQLALETEAQQQRRAFRDRAVLAPRPPAPVHLGGQELLGRIALGV